MNQVLPDILPTRVHPLTEQELYLFDSMGFIHLPGFISRSGVSALKSEALALSSRFMSGRADKERFDDLVGRSETFRTLASHDGVLNSARSVINQPMRLIESYALRRSGPSVFFLHNGNSELVNIGGGRTVRRDMTLNHTYHDGRLYCTFVKMLVYLDNVPADEDGPFCYLQGSHKANFACFPDGVDAADAPELTRSRFPSLETTPVAAGDAILLNEALFHGTLPKDTSRERTVLAFSYAPAFVADWKEIDVESADLKRIGHY